MPKGYIHYRVMDCKMLFNFNEHIYWRYGKEKIYNSMNFYQFKGIKTTPGKG